MDIEEAKTIPISLVKAHFGKYEVKPIPNGNAIDYVRAYLRATGEDNTIVDALRWINLMVAQGDAYTASSTLKIIRVPSIWSVTRVDQLEDLALIRYAEERRIPFELAYAHFDEVYIKHRKTGERMYVLGFKNEEGGYALRNIFLQTSTEPHSITFKRGKVTKPKALHLFEGSFDYLSALIRFPQHLEQHDSIVLNSLSNLNEAWPYILGYGYKTLYSWMDNDHQGRSSTRKINTFAVRQPGLSHKPLNGLYLSHKDVNAWHQATYTLPHTY
jgi:hypothetical protein